MGSPAPTGNGSSDVVVQLRGIVQQLSAWVTKFSNRAVFGTFNLAAAATTTVTQPGVQATSRVIFTAANASAGTLMGSSKSLYVSVITPGSGFTVHTADGTNAAGTESFSYTVLTPS